MTLPHAAPVPGHFQPRITLRTLGRGDGLLGLKPQGPRGPRGGQVTLAQIDCPTLVIAADADRLRSLDEARELADGIVGAQLRIIEGSGHMVPLEAPEVLATLIVDWLGSQRFG